MSKRSLSKRMRPVSVSPSTATGRGIDIIDNPVYSTMVNDLKEKYNQSNLFLYRKSFDLYKKCTSFEEFVEYWMIMMDDVETIMWAGDDEDDD